jgi:hypothetical protein
MQLDLDPKAIQHARAGFERLIDGCLADPVAPPSGTQDV